MWIKFLEQCSKHKSLHGVTFNQIQYYIDIMGKWWHVLTLSPQSYNNLQLSSNTMWHHHVNNLQTWKCDVMGQFCWTGAGGASHFLYQGLKGCLLVNSELAWREELDSGFLLHEIVWKPKHYGCVWTCCCWAQHKMMENQWNERFVFRSWNTWPE